MGLMINDVDLKTTYKFVTTDVNGRGAPPVERSTLEDLSFDGAIELGTKLAKRDISITGYVYGTSPSDARTNKDNLISFISQGYTDELKITFPDTSRSIYAKLAGTPIVWQAQGPTLNAVAYSVTMNFVALDPYFYGSDFSATGNNASGLLKLSTEAPLYLIDPRRSLYKREPKMKVYPVTVVNLLGKYGDFETDSNSDGIADGLINAYPGFQMDLVSNNVVFGQKAQRAKHNSMSYVAFSFDFTLYPNIVGNKYFISTYAYHPNAVAASTVFVYNDDPWQTISLQSLQEKKWLRLYGTYTAVSQNTGGYNRLEIMTSSPAEAIIDGAMLVDLTRMGVLPPPLKEYFNNVPSKWADLATASNITAIDGKVQSGNAWLNDLLPYVNGVGTLGYAWGV